MRQAVDAERDGQPPSKSSGASAGRPSSVRREQREPDAAGACRGGDRQAGEVGDAVRVAAVADAVQVHDLREHAGQRRGAGATSSHTQAMPRGC